MHDLLFQKKTLIVSNCGVNRKIIIVIIIIIIMNLRDPTLAHSLPRSLAHALSARSPGLPVRSDTSVPSSSPGDTASSPVVLRLFSAPISASTENACALTLSAHGDRRFSAISPRGRAVRRREDMLKIETVPTRGSKTRVRCFRATVCPSPSSGQRNRGALQCLRYLFELRVLLERVNNQSLEERRRKGTCQSQNWTTNHNWSQPLRTFSWSRPLWGLLVPPYVVKGKAGDWIISSCLLECRGRPSRGIFPHTGPTCFAYLLISASCTVATCGLILKMSAFTVTRFSNVLW